MQVFVRNVLIAFAMMSVTAFGQTIRLKPQAAVELHQDVRLGDIASVTAGDGRQAEELANTVIISGIEKPRHQRRGIPRTSNGFQARFNRIAESGRGPGDPGP